jgi:hypothetical protein
VLGDIDVMIPHEKLGELFDVLARLEGKSLWHNRVTYVGQNKHQQSGHQINAIFAFAHPESSWEQFVQIDFEGVEFDANGVPTEFSEFAHSTSPADADAGIKGVAHKYLLTNLIRAASELQDALVLTEKSPPPPDCRISMSKKIPREYAFSVDRGLRKKLEPVMYNGAQFRVGDKRVFRELATDESIYDTNIANIAKAALGNSSTPTPTGPLGSSSAAGVASSPNATSVPNDFSLLLSTVKSINIDTSIFTDPTYKTLRDHPIDLGTEDIGRPNPFAPVGIDIGTISGTGSTTTAPAAASIDVQTLQPSKVSTTSASFGARITLPDASPATLTFE